MIEIYEKIIKLVKDNPNDMNLGSKVRKYMADFIIVEHQYQDVIKSNNELFKKMTKQQ